MPDVESIRFGYDDGNPGPAPFIPVIEEGHITRAAERLGGSAERCWLKAALGPDRRRSQCPVQTVPIGLAVAETRHRRTSEEVDAP